MAKPIKTAQRRPDGTFGRPEQRFEQVPDKDKILVEVAVGQVPHLMLTIMQLQSTIARLEEQLKEVK